MSRRRSVLLLGLPGLLAALVPLVAGACGPTVRKGEVFSAGPAHGAALEGPRLVFLAVGDTGMGDATQRAVARGMERAAERSEVALVLLLGDNFYPVGVASTHDPRWRTCFEDVYRGALLDVAFFPALGNHDHVLDPGAQVAYTRPDGRWRLPARHHRFTRSLADATRIDFFVLDTFPLVERRWDWREQLTWLESELAASTAHWKVVAGHHPVRSEGEHGSEPRLIERLEPLFQRYRVDLYLAGHDHDLQLLTTEAGYLQVVSGAGSKLRGTGVGRRTLFAAARNGFARVTLTPSGLAVEFLDAQADVLHRHVGARRAVRSR